ncbi:MAG: ATP-binding cassette domain-containing protein [Corynebacteriales bacterium]|nr:ATP-binding cassette domain-containing protein [Mycobacteriales bacterium]
MIETHGLTRHFKVGKETVEAVRGLDFHINKGELVALLGPNGAGKSTTLRMLTTLLPPTAGTAAVAGYDIASNPRQVRQHIGYIGQGNGAGHTQRGREELITQGRFYGLNKKAATARADELIEALDLAAVTGRNVGTLSGGQRRRLDIAMGLIHEPELLFLDEPSTGLDPQNRANLQEQIQRLHTTRGTTIVLTTHYLEEADAMAERVIVVDHGRIIADDTAQNLKNNLAGDRITLTFGEASHTIIAAEHVTRLRPQAAVTPTAGSLTIRTIGGPELLPSLLRDLDDQGAKAQSAEVVRPTLDDVFLALTGRSLRESTNTDVQNAEQEVAA